MDKAPEAREAMPHDFAAYRALFEAHECLRELGREQGDDELVKRGDLYVDGVLETELRSWDECAERFAAPGSRLWVMEMEGKVVGSVGAVHCAAGDLELVRMYVDHSCRRRGYGQILVQQLLDHARSLSVSQVTLTTPQVNVRGISFYEKLGFELDRTFTVSLGSPGLQLEIVELSLILS
ncbi:unnamed protein product [Polarella glacialis]|uniref:N-acetyltransferase domain-containing protein n=1 Tax=Polarella glacialis TaxID=89957 RepID=A0A813LKR5_POLGL|nr:unnamed protein product [Polarella glacialis]